MAKVKDEMEKIERKLYNTTVREIKISIKAQNQIGKKLTKEGTFLTQVHGTVSSCKDKLGRAYTKVIEGTNTTEKTKATTFSPGK